MIERKLEYDSEKTARLPGNSTNYKFHLNLTQEIHF